MKRLMFTLLVVVNLLGAPVVFAQDDNLTPLPGPLVTNTPAPEPTLEPPPPVEEPEQPPVVDAPLSRTEIVLIGALFIASALLSVFAASFVVFSKRLLEAAPPWIRELIRENAGRGLDELDRRARETPTVLDDELARQIRELVLKALAESVEQSALKLGK